MKKRHLTMFLIAALMFGAALALAWVNYTAPRNTENADIIQTRKITISGTSVRYMDYVIEKDTTIQDGNTVMIFEFAK